MLNKTKNYLATLFLMTVLLVIWEVTVRFRIVNSIILPAPTDIFRALISNWDVILVHSWQTLQETLLGLILAVISGLGVAVILDENARLRKSVYPLLVISQTIPMIALAPLLLIWFGFDMSPKVIIVVLSCFFPITVATLDGFAKTDGEILKLFKSMNATYLQTLRLVKLPGASPQFFSGLKIAATYSVTAAIVGEYVGAYQGLGIYMQEMAHSHAIALVFAAIIVTGLMTVFLFLLVTLMEKLMLPWYIRQ